MLKNNKITVYKFGGGILNSAKNIKKCTKIIQTQNSAVIVVSAMGKTTNMLEILVEKYRNRQDTTEILQKIKNFHIKIIDELEQNQIIKQDFLKLFIKLNKEIKKAPTTYIKDYNRIIAYGELFSSQIISKYLSAVGIENIWIDIRELIITENDENEADVNTSLSFPRIKNKLQPGHIYITQGFIAQDKTGNPSNLGREGSDYTAAIIARALNVKELTIWKDVNGIYNADPKKFPEAHQISHIDYKELLQMGFLGAKIIHYKTAIPLQKANIALKIKPVDNPMAHGTTVMNLPQKIKKDLLIISRENLILLELNTEKNVEINTLQKIFNILKINNITPIIFDYSAWEIFFIIENKHFWKQKLLNDLKNINNIDKIYTMENINLIILRHYTQNDFDRIIKTYNVIKYKCNPEEAFLIISPEKTNQNENKQNYNSI